MGIRIQFDFTSAGYEAYIQNRDMVGCYLFGGFDQQYTEEERRQATLQWAMGKFAHFAEEMESILQQQRCACENTEQMVVQ